jgi:hypothetical protein
MEPITEQEVKTFVGRNAAYYYRRWGPALKGQGAGYDHVGVAGLWLPLPKTGFNWVAFLLSGFWLPYRKMYVATFIFLGIILAESIIAQILFVGILSRPDAPVALGRLVGLIAGLFCGLFGNRWYLSHARKEIAKVRSQGLAEEEHLRELSRRGGTSLLAAFRFLFLFIVAVLVVTNALDLLFTPS